MSKELWGYGNSVATGPAQAEKNDCVKEWNDPTGGLRYGRNDLNETKLENGKRP